MSEARDDNTLFFPHRAWERQRHNDASDKHVEKETRCGEESSETEQSTYDSVADPTGNHDEVGPSKGYDNRLPAMEANTRISGAKRFDQKNNPCDRPPTDVTKDHKEYGVYV